MSQGADNFRFDITAWDGHYTDRDMLTECLKIAFAAHGPAVYWEEMSQAKQNTLFAPKRLVLYWTNPVRPTAHKLLSELGPEAVTSSVRAWLASAEYGPEPYHDGGNSKGWRIYNEAWGHVADQYEAICAIEPAWLMHGK